MRAKSVRSGSVRVGTGSGQAVDDDEVDRLLGECLERYSEAAPLDDLTQLKTFLPDSNAKTVQFVLVELIKLDMAMASESGTVPKIEHYLDALPDHLSADSIPVDLVMEEVQLRRELGDEPKHEDYKARFPQFDSVIAPMLGVPAEVTAAVKNRQAPPELEVGGQVDDFLIIQTLGSGAFAHVYLARQVSMHRLVALKVSRGTGDEPQALSQLDHPNIVRVYDQREIDDPNVHMLYMQFHPGGTLSDVVKHVKGFDVDNRNGQLLLDTVDRQLLKSAQLVPERSTVRKWLSNSQWSATVAWLGVGLARALDDAHQRGVLHRDVKPANVLLSAEGIPKLADFNVSFAGAAGRAGAASSFGGSIGYMSPEHLRAISPRLMDQSEEVGEKADFYSLAILLWELWQGSRPFSGDAAPASWTDAVAQQLASRSQPLVDPARSGTASERVLEATLRYALAENPEDRPSSGAEFAGRLKLALHPDAAKLFDPDAESWKTKILKWSPWIVPSVVLFVPNLFVMLFNFLYNQAALLGKHGPKADQADRIEGLTEYFESLALTVTVACLVIGLVFAVWLMRRFVTAVEKASQNEQCDQRSILSVVRIGQNAAIVGGLLWAVAGLVYPLALKMRFPELPTGECVRFFFSLVICGGVASVYPFFGMMTLGTLVYYPRVIKNSMQDPGFDNRAKRVVQQSRRFWQLTVLIPLIGIALLVFSDAPEKPVVLSAVAATFFGALLALQAYTVIQNHWQQMATVLSKKDASVTPGLEGGQESIGLD